MAVLNRPLFPLKLGLVNRLGNHALLPLTSLSVSKLSTSFVGVEYHLLFLFVVGVSISNDPFLTISSFKGIFETFKFSLL